MNHRPWSGRTSWDSPYYAISRL